MDLKDFQERFSDLVQSRPNHTPIVQGTRWYSPLRALGSVIMYRLRSVINMEIKDKEAEYDQIIEDLVRSIVRASNLGLDLETELTLLLGVMESVSSEAS